ncbi:MAG: KRRI-Interacting protein 1 [Thelocarpon superellum]|nr:MAG: KRRI-Interacting protein 1 [Thelocarpon superellum]
MQRPSKKAKLMLDSASSESEDAVGNGNGVVEDGVIEEAGFKINQEFARRFDHNKKREELHRLEEKYGKGSAGGHFRASRTRDDGKDQQESDDDSSTSEEEDDEAFLATEQLDAEISATLAAIKSKDPRVYDEKVTFYAELAEDAAPLGTGTDKVGKEKPMYLSDYHRKMLLDGPARAEEDATPPTYAQEQNALQRDVIQQMHAAADAQNGSGEETADNGGEADDFLTVKHQGEKRGARPSHPPRAKAPEVPVALADNDPESFLSNFMAARAWRPAPGSRFQPFESDDEEEEERAEVFEEAYNLRFEDPQTANEKLMSHARDAIAKHSVRREEASGRKKVRQGQREKKEAEKQQRDEEKARWRRLKIDEVEARVQRIKEASGLRGTSIDLAQWRDFLDGNWDGQEWEQEMARRFGEDYYNVAADDVSAGSGGTKKPRKPKWDDDIDIRDLVPDFDEDAADDRPPFTLADAEDENAREDYVNEDEDEDEDGTAPKRKQGKDRAAERSEKKRMARHERRAIEALVDDRMDLDPAGASSSGRASRFPYRETSPVTYGLTPRDILMASDSQLNQYAGLKKLATFRDTEKKRKDKRRLGKKARLRQWRKDTFGHEDGPSEDMLGQVIGTGANADGDTTKSESKTKKKRKRSNRGKGTSGDA